MALTLTFIDILTLREGHVIKFTGSAQITLDIADSLALVDVFVKGLPLIRVSQVPVEMVISPTDAKARISQVPVEMVILPTDASARVSQVVLEIVGKRPAAAFLISEIDIKIF